MKNELEALASELPILTDKSSYKYLSEVAGNGKYIQVAWQKKECRIFSTLRHTIYQVTPN